MCLLVINSAIEREEIMIGGVNIEKGLSIIDFSIIETTAFF